jgi:hypothetical protein
MRREMPEPAPGVPARSQMVEHTEIFSLTLYKESIAHPRMAVHRIQRVVILYGLFIGLDRRRRWVLRTLDGRVLRVRLFITASRHSG